MVKSFGLYFMNLLMGGFITKLDILTVTFWLEWSGFAGLLRLSVGIIRMSCKCKTYLSLSYGFGMRN